MIDAILEQLLNNDVNLQDFTAALTNCLENKLTDAQMGAFLALVRTNKNEEVLSRAAQVMQDYVSPIDLSTNELIDVVGTGGDLKNTFNISTVTSFVAAGAGAKVVKHGNHSVSSRSGAADFLLAAGINLTPPISKLIKIFQKTNIIFLFAPHFNNGFKSVKKVRSELKIKTFFNLLGPLLNPANPCYEVVGVYSSALLMPLAKILKSMGRKRALIVHGQDGLDEISIASPTEVVEFDQGKFTKFIINPKDYGFSYSNLDSIVVSSPEESLSLGMDVLHGVEGGSKDIVMLNAASVLYCANIARTFDEGVKLAQRSIKSGQALAKFNLLKELSNSE